MDPWHFPPKLVRTIMKLKNQQHPPRVHEMSNGWHKRACLRMEFLMESCCFWIFPMRGWVQQNSPGAHGNCELLLCASSKAQYQMKSGLLLNVVVRPRGCTLHGINISHLAKRKIIFKHDFWWDMLVPYRVCFCSTLEIVFKKWGHGLWIFYGLATACHVFLIPLALNMSSLYASCVCVKWQNN